VGRRRAQDGPLRRRRPAARGDHRSVRFRRGRRRGRAEAPHDGGSCFRSAHYQAEIDHLGIDRSPAFHYEPETNGVVEKFIQTLKEQVLWIERFDTLEQLRAGIRQFADDYNEHWLLERHGYRTPRQAAKALRQAAMT